MHSMAHAQWELDSDLVEVLLTSVLLRGGGRDCTSVIIVGPKRRKRLLGKLPKQQVHGCNPFGAQIRPVVLITSIGGPDQHGVLFNACMHEIKYV